MTRRIGICGLALESNRFAPATRLADFESYAWLEGTALAEALRRNPSLSRFAARMDDRMAGAWQPVPLLLAVAESGGPVAAADLDHMIDRLCRLVAEAGDLDGLFVYGHGAGTTSDDGDMDGRYLSALRAVVGPFVPIVAVLDYHANISDAMMAAIDLPIGYRTNPHMDIADRCADAADVLIDLIAGRRVHVSWLRLPLITPQVVQRTAVEPMRGLMRRAEAWADRLAGVSVFPGFALGDTPDNGLTVTAASWGEPAPARTAVLELADLAWRRRAAFKTDLVPVDRAVALAQAAAAPILLADIADNPGGGGRGNTPHLMRALKAAGVEGVQIAPVFDPALVARTDGLTPGDAFDAVFNAGETARYSGAYATPARLVRRTDGAFDDTVGMGRGQRTQLGASCLIDIGGILVGVSSRRRQTLSVDYFRHFGLVPEDARVLVVKSRGHFRAGFEHLIPPNRVFEVDAPGLVTANLARVPWRFLTRPIYPLDPDTVVGNFAPMLKSGR